MRYLIELRAPDHHVIGTDLVDEPTGRMALADARADLARFGADHADVFQADGFGGFSLFFATERVGAVALMIRRFRAWISEAVGTEPGPGYDFAGYVQARRQLDEACARWAARRGGNH